MAAVLAKSPVGVASSAAGRFEVGYVSEDGAEHRVRLDEAWLVPLERVLPVRRFGSRKGQRHLSGLWWSAAARGSRSRHRPGPGDPLAGLVPAWGRPGSQEDGLWLIHMLELDVALIRSRDGFAVRLAAGHAV